MKKIPSHALLDALLQVQGIKNDAALARDLDVTPSVLSKMRKYGGCSNDFRISVMRQFKWTLPGIDNFAPPSAKD